MLAVNAVIQCGERLDLGVIGAFIKLEDALQHDLNGLADSNDFARDIGERQAWHVSSADLIKGRDFGSLQRLGCVAPEHSAIAARSASG
jgi:hypothetical protein